MAKKDIAESAVNDVENDEGTGRKTRAKRPVYFYAVPAGTQLEEIKMPGESWNQKEAEDKLREKLGSDCKIVGPNYHVQGVKSDTNSLTVKVDLRSQAFTSDRFSGDHGEWTFIANGLAACEAGGVQYQDNELVQIQFEKPLDPENRQPKPRIGGRIVRRELLDNVVPC